MKRRMMMDFSSPGKLHEHIEYKIKSKAEKAIKLNNLILDDKIKKKLNKKNIE